MPEASDATRAPTAPAVPRLPPGVVSRPRLLARLETGADLTFVRGPAGAGKTTLLAGWARERASSTPLRWLDAATLAPVGLDPAERRATVDAATLAAAVAAELEAASRPSVAPEPRPRPTTLVLDNAHVLDDAALHHLVEILERTSHLRLFVASRSPRVLADPALTLRLDVETITDLRLTAAEVEQVTGCDAATARRVLAVTAGLPLAVRALGLSAGPGDGLAGPLRDHLWRDPHGPTVAALAPHVLAPFRAPGADPAHLGAMIAATFSDELTPALARLLTGDDAVTAWLDRAEEDGAGTWLRTPAPEPVFRLTPVVRAVLLTERARLPQARARALHRRHATWALAEGHTMTAVRAAVAADDLELASSAVRQAGIPVLVQHGAALVRVLSPLPLRRLRQHPVLALALGLCLNARREHRLRALELFATAKVGVATSGAVAPMDRALLRALESVVMRLTSVGDGGVTTAARAVTMLDELDLRSREELTALLPDLYVHSGITMLHGGRHEDAVHLFERSTALGATPRQRRHAHALLAGTHAVLGHTDKARRWQERALALPWNDDSLDEYTGSFVRLSQSLLALERADLVASQEALTRIWPIIETIEHWPLLAWSQLLLDVARGDAAVGTERFGALRAQRSSALGTPAFLRRRLDETAAVGHLAAGEPGRAAALLAGSGHGDALALVARARLALARGEAPLALERLARAGIAGLPHARARGEHAALESAALLRVGTASEAHRSLERTTAILEAAGTSVPVLLVPPTERARLTDAIVAGARREREADVGDVGAVVATLQRMREKARGASSSSSFHGRGDDDAVATPRLTAREQVVLDELAASASIATIAVNLVVSPNTVKSQLRSLYRKLGVSTREEAIAAAAAGGLFVRGSAR